MTIVEVSKQYGISTETLRYYERVGLIPCVHRTQCGYRDYTTEDLEWISFVITMQCAGISLEALIDYAQLLTQENDTRVARKQILLEQRHLLVKKIQELQKVLDQLDHKLEGYEQCEEE